MVIDSVAMMLSPSRRMPFVTRTLPFGFAASGLKTIVWPSRRRPQQTSRIVTNTFLMRVGRALQAAFALRRLLEIPPVSDCATSLDKCGQLPAFYLAFRSIPRFASKLELRLLGTFDTPQ